MKRNRIRRLCAVLLVFSLAVVPPVQAIYGSAMAASVAGAEMPMSGDGSDCCDSCFGIDCLVERCACLAATLAERPTNIHTRAASVPDAAEPAETGLFPDPDPYPPRLSLAA